MHCGLLRDCAGARKAKESLLWYGKKNLDNEERKRRRVEHSPPQPRSSRRLCLGIQSSLLIKTRKRNSKVKYIYIYIYVFWYIYAYIYICINIYVCVWQNILMFCSFATVYPCYTAFHHLKELHLTWLPCTFLHKDTQFSCGLTRGFSLDLLNGNILCLHSTLYPKIKLFYKH